MPYPQPQRADDVATLVWMAQPRNRMLCQLVLDAWEEGGAPMNAMYEQLQQADELLRHADPPPWVAGFCAALIITLREFGGVAAHFLLMLDRAMSASVTPDDVKELT